MHQFTKFKACDIIIRTHRISRCLYCYGKQFFLQQMISARNWEGGHWWVCLPLPLLYLIFSVIYWAAGGTNDVRKTR